MPTMTKAMIHAGMLKKNIAPGLSRANTTSSATPRMPTPNANDRRRSMLTSEAIAAGMIVIARISHVYRLRPIWSSTRWPKNQKNTSVSTTQIDVGGLGIGQVTIRQTSPSRTRLDRNISFWTNVLRDRVGEHRGDAEEDQQRRGGDVERADPEPAVALAALGE